ncbi:hypothetical protein [Streptomyces acidiscabies]|uniref:Bacterial Ig domain-containing protein n=1 Tax=Streptomyces acidiscabies TaxID=42234 RepID=A0ABU4LWL9_9ACTN|nr:hypothetical protein [Streptomyces acidiscabies]MDX3019862.1 hypothetical protein [Streptomyces acidiscabies]GAQ52063.1 hypothetical protein a10_01844 [Streptomyces acidiscabies]
MLIPRWLMRHEVTIAPYLGDTSKGPKYGPGVPVRCFVDEQTRGVRSPAGEQVTSTSTVYADPGTTAPQFSLVTLPSGRTTKVIQTKDRNGGGLPTPDHVEIQLE